MKMILILLFLISFNINGVDIDFVRTNYTASIKDKQLCSRMISELKKKNDRPINLGYLGGLQTIWANHVFNPINKLKTFKEGKNKIEKAIKLDPENVELRFIRLSIQKNAPSFLGYNSNINSDKEFIKSNQKTISSAIVRNNINQLIAVGD
ncbi:hypothetical protein M3B46_05785 [Sphingobacterium daejeonense]|uniref:hypothetical protein n=1 Tax=Sphingobacterium daejeonense TaxID=371142 RepID=UPI0021A86CF3|nr:hypothetical protein [Sphingobacterium daejeonense]MCT1530497.1 hypothetical protein [Sphingobacterium daejeonense]